MTTCKKQYDIRAVANWILDRAESKFNLKLTNMAINKIVYFLCEQLLVEYDRQLSEAKIEAWEHGPVFREIYGSFKKHADGPISTRVMLFSILNRRLEVAVEQIDADDEVIFRHIVDQYIPITASQLRRISHAPDGPWFTVWTHEGIANPGMEITPKIIKNCFSGYKRNA